jgi:hypothetical protein
MRGMTGRTLSSRFAHAADVFPATAEGPNWIERDNYAICLVIAIGRNEHSPGTCYNRTNGIFCIGAADPLD